MIDVNGVSEMKDGKWITHIYIDGVEKYLGHFNTDAEVQEAYRIETNNL